jgi:muconate cycloisomerase
MVSKVVVGRDALDFESILRDVELSIIDNLFSKAAVEMALLDLACKNLELPVFRYLGGNVNPLRIPIKFSIGLRDPEDAARIAREKVREGFGAIKVKVGPDQQSDLERVRSVREAVGPSVKLNIDVNGGWSVKQALRFIPQYEEFAVDYVEQPTSRGDIEALALVTAHTNMPIMADESVFTVEHAVQVIRKRAADVISVYPGKNGGLLKSRLICKMAEAAGIACHVGSNLEWDIATAAMCHLAACTGNVCVSKYPVDILGPLYYDTRLRETPVDFSGGHVNVPSGPGFGLRVDEEWIRELSRSNAEMPVGSGFEAPVTAPVSQ